MGAVKAICIVLATYSIIPAPQVEWTETSMRYSLCALPVVGIIIGCTQALWAWLCISLGIGQLFFGAVAAAIPILLSGGIHMDGFCDTVDAIASHQPRERRLEILKDPHTGAFAIIYAVLYMLLSFGAYTELYDMRLIAVAGTGYVLSRALCVLTILLLPNARNSGMLSAFSEKMARNIVWAVTMLFMFGALLCMFIMHLQAGLACALLCFGWVFAYRAVVMHQFGGITGDTSGFFVQMAELMMLLGCVAGRILCL